MNYQQKTKIALKKKPPHAKAGLTLLEIMVSLAILGVIVIAFTSTFWAVRFANETKNQNRAATIAEAALEALRSAGALQIQDQIDESFLNVLINQGAWDVYADSSAPSLPNALREKISSPASGQGVSGLLLLTPNISATSTVEAVLRWSPEGPGPAKAGIVLRGRDLKNGYFYSVSETGIKFEKNSNGTLTLLFERSGTYLPANWHKLKVAASGNQFSLYYNDLLIGTANDSTYASGEIALFAGGALISADDISITGDASASWNFDSDEVGGLPAALNRLGLGHLPQGRGVLTVEDAFPSATGLKKATAKVFWTEPQGEKNITAATLIKQ